MRVNVEQRAAVAYLKERLSYDRTTGLFMWRIPPRTGPKWQGGPAGYSRNGSYVRIMVDRLSYYAHQLAWAFVTDEWPKHEIDHRDRDRTNNRFENLRDVPHVYNGKNFPGQNRLRGATPTRNGRWRAQIKCDYRNTHIGTYDTEMQAHLAYVAKAKELFGEFAGVHND